MKLIRNKNSNHYCGPGALALLTGVHVDDAARVLRMVSGRPAIRGTYAVDMVKALVKLGYRANPVPVHRNAKKLWPTLVQALAGVLRGRDPETVHLMNVGHHWVVVKGRKLWDNKNPEGLFLGESPYRRRRVKQIWAVVKVGPTVVPPVPPKAMTFAQYDAALSKLGLNQYGGMVDAPEGFQFQSGLHAVSAGDTYEETLERLQGEMPLEACPQDCDCREEMQ